MEKKDTIILLALYILDFLSVRLFKYIHTVRRHMPLLIHDHAQFSFSFSLHTRVHE